MMTMIVIMMMIFCWLTKNERRSSEGCECELCMVVYVCIIIKGYKSTKSLWVGVGSDSLVVLGEGSYICKFATQSITKAYGRTEET